MYAVMDIGTNSCRLLLATIEDGQELKIIGQHLHITRIGAGMGPERTIKLEAMERTLSALEEFALVIKDYPVHDIVLVATQAVRSARNKDQLVQLIKDRLDWDLQIITGEREAWLSYKGATSSICGESSPLVIDIGGGSTEFMLINPGEPVSALSIPLGALKLLENPLDAQELTQVVTEALQGYMSKVEGLSHSLVGVGGTCTTLAAVDLGLREYDGERIQGHKIEVARIKEISEMLSQLSAAERLEVAGIYAGREDIIIPGLQILLVIIKHFNSSSVLISNQDLLCGLIYEKVS